MLSDADRALQAVQSCCSVRTSAALNDLRTAVEVLFVAGVPNGTTEALFGLFERFPDDDGFGLFWSILHRLETLPDCGSELAASIRRRPTQMTITMLGRLLNGGREFAGKVRVIELLGDVSCRVDVPAPLRKACANLLEREARREGTAASRSPLDVGFVQPDPPITVDDILQAICDGHERREV